MPAHPIPIEEISDRVLADARLAAAAKIAQDEAQKFVNRAAVEIKVPLHSRAASESKALITTPLLDQSVTKIDALKLDGVMMQMFNQQAHEMLRRADGTHAFGKFDLPSNFTSYAYQINQIKPDWSVTSLPERQTVETRNLGQRISMTIRGSWFKYAEISARSQYVSMVSSEKK